MASSLLFLGNDPAFHEHPVPPPYSFDEDHENSAARALGLTRAEFDELIPRE